MARRSEYKQVALLVKLIEYAPGSKFRHTLSFLEDGKILVKRSNGRGWKVWALLGARYRAFVPNVVDYFKAQGYTDAS